MPEELRNLVLGTGGHIDHGKTSLLKALTGIDADRLKEERERGITIDLGFAHLLDPPFVFGFVDVPGHEKFIKNMLAGAGGIDALLLVVAADQGVMPQTREHFEIASLLGIRQGIIALNKIDATEPEYVALAEEYIRELVAGTFLEAAPVIRTSARTGEGLDRLRDALRTLARSFVRCQNSAIPRLFVDRAFIMKGMGVVVTGTVRSGVFRRNDPVAIYPPGLPAKIRQLQLYGQEEAEAGPGCRAAFNLTGVELTGLARGMVIGPPGALRSTQRFNARFRLLPSFGKKIRNLLPVHVYHGSAELLGRLELIAVSQLEPGQETMVQIQLEEPTVLWPGDHFIIRQYSPLVTMGGGQVLENQPPRFRRKESQRTTTRLMSIPWPDGPAMILHELEQAGLAGLTLTSLQFTLARARGELLPWLEELQRQGKVRRLNPASEIWVRPPVLETIRRRLTAALAAHLADNPNSPGLPKPALYRSVKQPPAELFEQCLLETLSAGEVTVAGDCYLPAGRGSGLAPEVEARLDKLRAFLQKAGTDGAGPEDIQAILFPDGRKDPALLDYIQRRRLVVKAAADYWLDPAVLDGVISCLRERLKKGDPVEVGLVKDLFGLTRKRAIPLLEHLDRQGVTFRSDNQRRLR